MMHEVEQFLFRYVHEIWRLWRRGMGSCYMQTKLVDLFCL